MTHKCPHCQKPIAVKMILDIVTQEQFMDEYTENNKKEKENDKDASEVQNRGSLPAL